MICSIYNYKEFYFTGDLSHIKEFIYEYSSVSMVEKLELTKNKDNGYVFIYNGDFSKDLSDINDLYAVRKNVKLMITKITIVPEALKMPYFYAPSVANVDSLDKLVTICKRGNVSDVYISGELGFNMDKVRTIANKYNVQTRVIPNSPSLSGFLDWAIKPEETLTAFWIRPEDLLKYYSDYIDVVEFYGSIEQQAVYYNIYFQEKKWIGNLSEITMGQVDLDNSKIIPLFTEFRLNCKKKCLEEQCHSCHRMAATAKLLVENKLEIEIQQES